MSSVTHSVIEFIYSSKVFGNRIVRIFVSKEKIRGGWRM
jgi:hypothetical protein